MGMLHTKTGSYNQTSVMPEVAHRNISTQRNWINKSINFLFNLIEVLAIATILIGLYFYRLSYEFGEPLWTTYGLSWQLPRLLEYTIFFVLVILLWLAWIYYFKALSLKGDISVGLFEEIVRCIKAISYSVLITIGIAFVFKLTNYSRFIVLAFWGSSIMVSVGLRSLKRLLMVSLAKKGLLVKNVIIMGAGKVGTLISEELANKPSLGYQIIGFIDDEKKGNIASSYVLGKCKDIEKIIKRYPVDEIIITIPTERELINNFLNDFRKYDITIKIVPELFNLVSKTIHVESINSIPYITLIKTPMRGIAYAVKRSMDFVLSSLGIIALLPLFLFIAVLIKSDSKGSIIYKQKRVGRSGKFFYMYKFRSMVEKANDMKHKLKEQNEMDGAVFKMSNDPRVTRIGRFIRKYSIDELPQLFNVLKGDMSLIGPRPPLPLEVEQYSDLHWRRLEVVPGITGLWQVSGRSELSFDQWVNLDIYYIENWSLLLDIKILLKTIPVVIKGEGAY
jgi:exopolysaccharide biosynthesis polyprenyl glycosylphosphotransferase